MSSSGMGLCDVPHHANLINVEVVVVLPGSVRPEAMLTVERLGTVPVAVATGLRLISAGKVIPSLRSATSRGLVPIGRALGAWA